MADRNVFIGQQRFLQLGDEIDWPTAALTFYDVPCDSFNVRNKPKRRNGQARVGLFQPKYGANVSAAPSGNLVTKLYADGTQVNKLLAWAFGDHETKFTASKTATWQYVGHDDDKTFTGLRVNSATLNGSDAGVILTLELMGATSTNAATSASPPNDRKKLIEFLFEDTAITIGGSALSYSAFTWSVKRNLHTIYNNSTTPQSMPKKDHTETFSVTPLKGSNAFDVLRDTLGMQEAAGTLVLAGRLAAGTTTTCTVTFPRLSLIDSDESGDPDAIYNPLNYDVLKPDTSSNGSSMAFVTA